VTAREIGRVTIAEALELTALVARKQLTATAASPPAGSRSHEKATLEEVALLVSNLGALEAPKDHAPALAILRKAARQG
jgi:hypothetical protein